MSDGRTIDDSPYCESLGGMLDKYDRLARKSNFKGKTTAEFESWRKETRALLHALLGLDKMDTASLNPKTEETVALPEGITREEVVIQVEPGVYMPFYVLIPQGAGTSTRCFICPPGHAGAGKHSVAGRREIPAVNSAIDRFNYDYGLQLAKLGYVAVCPDCRGFGRRREKDMQGTAEDKFLNGSCYHLAHMGEPLGIPAAGMLTWDLMRLADYLEERGEWNISELSCLGFSGGGMQTMWFAAMDDRVKLSFISGYMYGYRDALLKLNNNCSCNYVPGLWLHLDMGDIASLIAPRALVVQSCKDDHLNGERGVVNAVEQVEIIKAAYSLFGKENRLYHDICEGIHHFDSENMAKAIEVVLNG